MGIWTKSNHTKSLYYGYASGNMNQSMPTYNVSYLTMVLPVELWTKNKSHQVTFLWLCQWEYEPKHADLQCKLLNYGFASALYCGYPSDHSKMFLVCA